MVFCLLPNRKADTYAAVKKLCCLDHDPPIASQCLLVSTIRAEDKVVAVATKVAIQMNCKLGGEPWMIQQKAANTMVIGIDTYHDTGNACVQHQQRPKIMSSRPKGQKHHWLCLQSQQKLHPVVFADRHAELKAGD